MFKKICIFTSGFLALQSAHALADTNNGENKPADKAEQIIVTGTYSASHSSSIANTVTLIDSAQIDQLGKTSLVDVLRSVPGLTVRQFGGAGGVNELYIRGGESNFTLVMIDGVKINDSTNTRGGGFNFNSLNMESIERIEIIRGTQSAIYGGDALAGVVNIITKVPEKNTISQNAFADLGTHNAYRIGYGIHAAGEAISAKLNVSSVDRGDEITGSDYKNKQIFAGLAWQLNDNTRFAWQMRYLDDERHSYTEQSGGDIYAQGDALELNTSEEISQNFSWEQRLNSHWQSRVDVNVFNRDSVMDSPGIAPFNAVPPNEAATEYKNNEIKWVNTFGTPNVFWVNAGLAFQNEKGESEGSVFGFLDTSFTLDRKNTAAFIEANYHKDNMVSTHLSLRYDDPDTLESETSFNFGLSVPVSKDFMASFNWGKGFKLPSFFALGHPLVGNANLKPERAKNSELRIRYRNEKFGTASLAWFDSHYSDLIDFDPDLFTNVNRALVDITGVDASWTFDSSKSTTVRVFATLMDIDTHDNNVVLSGRPESQYGVNFNWNLSRNKSLNLDLRRVAEQFDTSLYTGSTRRETLAGYALLDTSFTWQLSKLVSLQFVVNNAFNKKYFEAIGFSSPGRNFHIKAMTNF